jgi:RHS repeat-associated protein
VTYTLDRLGRQSTILCNGMTTTFAYNLAGQVLSETNSGGTLNGLCLTNGYDQFMRRTNMILLLNGSALVQSTNTFDAASRLLSIGDCLGNTATYSYVANSPLVSQIMFTNNGVPRMTTTKQYDFLNRLTSISSSAGSSSLSSFSYVYNSANQRTRATLADGFYWRYTYDPLGQVTSGKKFWSDQTPVAGQQFGYTFDDIGNRTQTQAGGDQNGGYLRTATYSPNLLNQYTSRDVPGAVDIMGLAYATNAVTVNGQTAYRKGEYFRDQYAVNNGSGPVWTNMTVTETGCTPVSGNAFVPKAPEQFTYDADGNLTQDGHWNYAWDGENRLVGLTNNASAAPAQVLRFEYDAKGRRIRKQVWSNSSGSGTPSTDLRFAYDGWNLLADFDALHAPPALKLLRSYVWGLDLSGSPQGAGGIAGLLEINYFGTQTTNCFAALDGNGNLVALLNAASGVSLAQYEYGPFGEVIRATGPTARANPFRFSTKYQDDETDLTYYGYRCYNASTGRWLSRDPILSQSPILDDLTEEYDHDDEEVAGQMTYVDNNPVSFVDAIGLWPSSSPFLGVLIGGVPLTHQSANQRDLPLSWIELAVVNSASVLVDQSQDVDQSFMHAMRNGLTGEDDTKARKRANDFVREHLSNAEDALCRCGRLDRYDALMEFGMALHTVQDSTSPAHNHKSAKAGKHVFRRWFGFANPPNVVVHVLKENFDPDRPDSALDKATRGLWEYFQCKETAPLFPEDFFHYGVDTRHGTYD